MLEQLPVLDIVEVALYMRKAHRNHLPRMDGSPYDCHPWDVMAIHRELFGPASKVVEAAILLHDVDEDHRDEGFDLADIAKRFGQPVADLVEWVTKPARPAGATKEEFNRQHYEELGKNGPDEACRIKVADRLHNLSDPERWNDSFRKRYIADTLNLITALHGRPGVQFIQTRLDVIRGA